MNYTHFHLPTGKPCRVISDNPSHRDGMSFCDFGSASQPFTWVKTSDLKPTPRNEWEAYSDAQLAEYIHRDIGAASWNKLVRDAVAELDRRINRS